MGAQPELPPLLPAENATTWAPGVRGIPARPEVCAVLDAGALGNGTREASGIIQTALDRCPAGQTVKLSAGTFLTNNHILINRPVTLRGAGPGETRLVKTNGARPMTFQSDDQRPVVIIGPNRWPKVDSTTSVNLVADAVAGSLTIQVANANGFAAGQFVLLDQDDYHTATWQPVPARRSSPPAAIWASDRVVFQRHNPPAPGDDPFPDSLTWFSRAGRPLNELKEITAIEGNIITFSTPVHTSYTLGKGAQLTRYTREHVHVRDAGIEDLTIQGGSDGNLRFEAAAYSWAKNIESTMWLGEGVAVNNSFRIEVRDSIVHTGAWPQPGGAGYGLSLAHGTSELLFENNVVMRVNKVMVARSSGAGSVVGYNYMDSGYIMSTPDWVEVGINGSHMAGGHHILFEGNQSFNYDSDNTHGNALAMTVFRNHLTGHRRDLPGMVNARGIGLMAGSWWHAFVGNVIGEPGRMAGWMYDDPGDGTNGHSTSQWGSAPAVWKLGYDPGNWDQSADPKVRATVVRDGNFDFLTNQVRWDRTERAIPDSLYLAGKPAFFGDLPWPWVDPTGAIKLHTLPARQRFDTLKPSTPQNIKIGVP
ncbi:MAG: pectate lyase [Acidobacteria bacterium]|nr:pectate lyase [Acidobacteriota bacterium]